ncbi:uncharacterized protein [Fopius arisanus]|uniref:MYND-type domain-containing protein n=1 Tax=Fopius arisanus TaxID=64838 RepID=A0A9R1T4W4_9HYME|nr:PREDICTED: uncharacterized protein LOC105266333 [Fopius arisanus]
MGRKKKPSNKSNGGADNSDNIVKSCKIKTNGNNSSKTDESTSSQISILDISSRLTLPLKPSGVDLSVDSDDEEILEFQIRPRFFYVSSLCLVCMNICEIRCDDCGMVSYCSEKHRNENKQQHMALCKVLLEICGGMEGFSLAKTLPPNLYRSFRIKTISLIENKIMRPLDLWEREIVLYPRICGSCGQVKELICCPTCGVDFYCANHQQNHVKWCKDFQVFRKILWMQHKHGFIEPDVPVVYYKEAHVLPENFDFLIYEMYRNSPSYRRIDSYTYASLSHVATAPLTALFAMQKTIPDWTTRTHFRIHVIGAEFQFECSLLRVWEKLFLHFIPRLKNLTIEFTGPELNLPPAPADLLGKIKMCRPCKSGGRRIHISFNPRKLYHDLKNESPADLICLFNPGLYRETGFDNIDTWPGTIMKFCAEKVPVVITSYTDFEIPRDVDRIKSIGDVKVLLEPQRNPFGAVKPDRNFVSDDVVPLMYKNHCISIVKGI